MIGIGAFTKEANVIELDGNITKTLDALLDGAIIVKNLGQPVMVIMSYTEYEHVFIRKECVTYKSGWYSAFDDYISCGEE
jgi:hypothetical protein